LTVGTSYGDNPLDGTVTGATADAEPNACGSNGPGVWYSVVVPDNGNLTIETGPDAATGDIGFDSLIEVFSGSCGMLTSIECDDDDGTSLFSFIELTSLNAGDTLYIRVWESGGNDDEPFSISAYNPLPNDECAGAEAITLGDDVSGNNTGATESIFAGSCFTGNIRDVWYAVDADAVGEIYVNGLTAGFQYAIYSACGGNELSCNAGATGLTDGITYYVRITDDGTGTTRASGAFTYTSSSSALSATDFDDVNSFKYYPNPK
jgi:hypothetical protein